MPYYPKSRIITNQIANPGQFVNIDGKPYSGNYYLTFDGRYFAGSTPQDKNTYPLVKINTPVNYGVGVVKSKDFQIYNNLNKGNIDITELKTPSSYYPIPTENDYKSKKLIRYFAKQRVIRMFKIMEIDKNTYEDILYEKGIYNYPMWEVTSLFWQISGPLNDERALNGVVTAGVLDTNKRIIDGKEKTFSGISQYLTNLQQFYKV